jgi:hypothetical protein
MKKLLKRTYIFSPFILLICWAIYNIRKDKRETKAATEKFTINYSGIIEKSERLEAAFAIFYLKTKSSSVKFYDPRKTDDFYLMVINDSVAEFIYRPFDEFAINDSVVIDGKNKLISVYKKDSLKYKTQLFVHNYRGSIKCMLEKVHRIKPITSKLK